MTQTRVVGQDEMTSRPGGTSGETTAATLRVNGRDEPTPSDLRVSLLDLLRDHLGLPGTKKGCDHGACGACTVLVDGQRTLACLTLAVQCRGRDVRTIEGVGAEGDLHSLQQAFIDHDGFQCGFCTPGQICSALGMISEARRGVPSAVTRDLDTEEIRLDEPEIRERMSGNLCRCGAYNGVVQAITQTFGRELR